MGQEKNSTPNFIKFNQTLYLLAKVYQVPLLLQFLFLQFFDIFWQFLFGLLNQIHLLKLDFLDKQNLL
jgi:hypothetical protein